MKRQLIITIGISGCGKSTICDTLYGNIPHVRLNLDSIRKEICGDPTDHSREIEVIRTLMIRLRETLRDRSDTRPMVMDNTNMIFSDRKAAYQMVEDMGYVIGEDIEVTLIYLPISIETAWLRQLSRERQVPVEVLQKQTRRFQCPSKHEAVAGIPYRMITINSHSVAGV